jgi:hypothetical protein
MLTNPSLIKTEKEGFKAHKMIILVSLAGHRKTTLTHEYGFGVISESHFWINTKK